MITGNVRNQIDAIWDTFWSGGISNPLEVIEQITYLLFLRRLDDLQTLEENKAARLKKPIERSVFPKGRDSKGRAYEDCRWSRFKHFEAKEMFEVVNDHVFPFLRTLGGDDSTYAHHMKDARFTIPTPALLAKVVDMIEQVPMEGHEGFRRDVEVMTVEFGTLFQFIRNGMNVKQDKSGDGLPITRIETISDATVDGARVGFAGLAEADCRDWLLETGDILFSHINSVEHIGKCAIYRGAPEKLVHGMNLLCLRSDTTKLLPEFAKYLIRGTEFRTRLSNFINKAVNQASVSIGNLKTIPVRVPLLAQQRRIAEVLDRAEALRVKRRAALAQLDSLTCVAKQIMLLEAIGSTCSGVTGTELASICKQLKTWPHPAMKSSLLGLYGFASDFSGVRHGTESSGMSRDIEMRDLIAMSILLTGCSPYLRDTFNSDRVYNGA